MTPTKYTSKHHRRARELAGQGFEPQGIRRILGREQGVTPTTTTLRTWVDEEYAVARKEQNRSHKLRRLREAGKVGWRANTVTAGWKLDRMRELRAAGLSWRGIGIVAGVWWGDYGLSVDQVRDRIQKEEGR